VKFLDDGVALECNICTSLSKADPFFFVECALNCVTKPLLLVVLVVISSFFFSLNLSTEFLLEFCVVAALGFFFYFSFIVISVSPVTELEPTFEWPLELTFEVSGEDSLDV